MRAKRAGARIDLGIILTSWKSDAAARIHIYPQPEWHVAGKNRPTLAEFTPPPNPLLAQQMARTA